MFSKILVIAFLRVVSVLMEANLQELCSRNNFDSILVQNKRVLSYDPLEYDLKYVFQLSRRMNSTFYHSWRILMIEETGPDGNVTGGLKRVNMSYKLEGKL